MSGPGPSRNPGFDFFDEDVFADIDKPKIGRSDDVEKFEGWDFEGEHQAFVDLATRQGEDLKNRDFYEFKQIEDASLASLFPSLDNTTLGSIKFRETSLEIWSKPIGSKPAGMYFSTEIVLSEDMPSDWKDNILSFFFPNGLPTFRIEAHLAAAQNPNDMIRSNGLILRGMVCNMSVPLIPKVTLVSVGAQVTIGRPMAQSPVEYGLIGQLLFAIPGTVTPLILDFSVELNDRDVVTMKMTYERDWTNALGVSGFHLKNIEFRHTFDAAKKLAKMERKEEDKLVEQEPATIILAEWQTTKCNFKVTGEIHHGDDWKKSNISCTLEHMTWADICGLYSEITGTDLDSTNHEIDIDELKLQISWGTFMLQGKVTVNGHSALSASIIFSSSGVSISGEITEFKVTDEVFINNARISLHIGRQGSEPLSETPISGDKTIEEPPISGGVIKSGDGSTSGAVVPAEQSKGFTTSFSVLGDIVYTNLRFQVVLTMQKAPNKGLEWMIDGRLNADALSLRDIFTSADPGSPLDVQLKSVRLVAANFDRPATKLNPIPVQKGIFVTALLETIPLLDQKALGTTSEPFVLSAGYSPKEGVTALIALPQSLQIRMGPHCVSESLYVKISSSAELRLAGRIRLDLEGQPDPLFFDMGVGIDALGFEGELSMTGRYYNPFGLGKNIALGDYMALAVGYTWAALPTGVPSKFGLAGGILVGEDIYRMAIMFGANPKDLLLQLDIKHFSLEKLVSFAGALMDVEFDISASKIIELHEVHVYASQGCMLGAKYYEAGYLLQGQIVVCGYKGSIDCAIGWDTGLKLKAAMDGFQLGPLKVSGARGEKNPILDLELTRDKQSFRISGMVSLFDLRVELFADCEINPTPKFFFFFDLSWSDLLHIRVQARMLSENLEKPQDHDFEIYALFEQHIIDHMVASILAAIEAAHQAIQQKLNDAQDSVRQAKADFERAIKEKEDELERLSDALVAKQRAIQSRIDALHNKREVEGAKVLDQKLAKIKEGDMLRENAKKDGEQKVAAEQNRLKEAKQKENSVKDQQTQGVNDACQELNAKKNDFSFHFGNAEQDIRRARDDVERAQWSLSSVEQEANQLRNERPSAGFWRTLDIDFQIAKLAIERGIKEAALATVKWVLNIALSILDSQLFRNLRDLVEKAGAFLESTTRHFFVLLEDAGRAIQLAGKALEVAALAATGQTEAAEKKAKELEQEANKVWNDFQTHVDQAIEEESLHLQNLGNSAEKLAVDAARAALEAVRKNDIAWKAAEGTLELVKKGEGAIYEGLTAAVKAAGDLVNIRKIELKGTLRASSSYCDPFTIHVDGVVAGQTLDFTGEWSPGKTAEFVAGVAGKALTAITGL